MLELPIKRIVIDDKKEGRGRKKRAAAKEHQGHVHLPEKQPLKKMDPCLKMQKIWSLWNRRLRRRLSGDSRRYSKVMAS